MAIERASALEDPEGTRGPGRQAAPARAVRLPSTSGRVRAGRHNSRRGRLLERGQAYCSGCGKPRPIILSPTVDPRYVVVQCGRVRRAGLYDRAKARAIIRERRKRIKAKKAAIRAAKQGAG